MHLVRFLYSGFNARHIQHKDEFDLMSSYEAVWASAMTAYVRGWIEPDVLKDDGNGEGAG